MSVAAWPVKKARLSANERHLSTLSSDPKRSTDCQKCSRPGTSGTVLWSIFRSLRSRNLTDCRNRQVTAQQHLSRLWRGAASTVHFASSPTRVGKKFPGRLTMSSRKWLTLPAQALKKSTYWDRTSTLTADRTTSQRPLILQNCSEWSILFQVSSGFGTQRHTRWNLAMP